MLEIARRSPRPSDVSLSEAGRLSLLHPHGGGARMEAYGHLALVQIIGAFDELDNTKGLRDEIEQIQFHACGLADEVLGDSLAPAPWVSSDICIGGGYYNESLRSLYRNHFHDGIGVDSKWERMQYGHVMPIIDEVIQARKAGLLEVAA